MLKGIDPLLTGRLLKILDEMGHGDQLLLVDRNYPAPRRAGPWCGWARWESFARWRRSSACSPSTSSSSTRWSGWRWTATRLEPRRNRMPSCIWRAPHIRGRSNGVSFLVWTSTNERAPPTRSSTPSSRSPGVLHPHEGRRLSGLRRVRQSARRRIGRQPCRCGRHVHGHGRCGGILVAGDERLVHRVVLRDRDQRLRLVVDRAVGIHLQQRSHDVELIDEHLCCPRPRRGCGGTRGPHARTR